MATSRPKRMTLLQLLVHTEKYSHDMREQFRVSFWPALSEFHDMSRPVRKRSHYPTLLAMRNALAAMLQSERDMDQMVANLEGWLQEILEYAQRQRERA